ncbi:MAG: hypothetical protein KGM49_13680 [Sphingomonadales bacterium]|nr:hypothetical protein [Sphingomonadales bacterium]
MNRLVLALLALFAGLVAPVAPAQARLGGAGSAEVGALESLDVVAKVCAASAVSCDARADLLDWRDKTLGRVRVLRPRVFIPSVYFGPDRAIE